MERIEFYIMFDKTDQLFDNNSNITVQDLFNKFKTTKAMDNSEQLADHVHKWFFKNGQNAQLYKFMVDNRLNVQNQYGFISTSESSKNNLINITIKIELHDLCTITLSVVEEYGIQSTPTIEVSCYSIGTNIADVENRLKRLFLS